MSFISISVGFSGATLPVTVGAKFGVIESCRYSPSF